MAKLQFVRIPKQGLPITLLVLGLLTMLSGWQYLSSRSTARLAASQWTSCRRIADQLAELRVHQPRLASAANRPSEDLLQRIRSAITSSGVSPTDVSRLDLLPAMPLQDAAVEYQSILVELEDVQMLQLVKTIRAILAVHPELYPTSIGLEALSVADEDWIADITFTQSIFRQ